MRQKHSINNLLAGTSFIQKCQKSFINICSKQMEYSLNFLSNSVFSGPSITGYFFHVNAFNNHLKIKFPNSA